MTLTKTTKGESRMIREWEKSKIDVYFEDSEQDGIQLYNQVRSARYVTRSVDDVFEIAGA